VAYRGGDSAGWRADSILMERLDKMTRKCREKRNGSRSWFVNG